MRLNVATLVMIGFLAVGCGRYADQLAAREVVVTFDAAASPDQHDAARTHCDDIPHVVAEPVPDSTLESSRRNDVRFRVDRANDADLARLYDCLRRQPGVQGVNIPSSR